MSYEQRVVCLIIYLFFNSIDLLCIFLFQDNNRPVFHSIYLSLYTFFHNKYSTSVSVLVFKQGVFHSYDNVFNVVKFHNFAFKFVHGVFLLVFHDVFLFSYLCIYLSYQHIGNFIFWRCCINVFLYKCIYAYLIIQCSCRFWLWLFCPMFSRKSLVWDPLFSKSC